jgi:hypothetical protein
MTRLRFAMMGVALFPTVLLSDTGGSLSCTEALEQVTALQTLRPVYKAAGGGARLFLDDAGRPAELARLQKIVTASCSSDPQLRASQEAEADRLYWAMSPECAVERDKLAAMLLPNSHEPRDFIERKQRLVAHKCPTVNTTDRWLVQWDGKSELLPEED